MSCSHKQLLKTSLKDETNAKKMLCQIYLARKKITHATLPEKKENYFAKNLIGQIKLYLFNSFKKCIS